jgi:PAS domain S-box-containing protein
MNQAHDQGELFHQDHTGLEHQYQAALLEAMFEADPGALAVLIGPDLRYAFVNPAYRFLHPDNGHELIGTRYADAGLHHNHTAFSEKIHAVYTSGAPYLQEKVEHSFPDGTCRILTLQARRFNWGMEAAVLLILWDTTELNEAKIALEESNRLEKQKTAQLEAFLEAAPALVWIAHDRECRVITGNTYSSEFLRMRPGDNLSKTAPEGQIPRHFHPMKEGRDIPPDQLPVQKAAASGEPVRDYDFDIVFEDGEVRHLFGNAAPLLDETGQPCGAVSAFVDITKREQAEEAFRESEERFRALAETSPIGVGVSSTEGKLVYTNRAYEKTLGYEPGELVGRPARSLYFDPAERQAWLDAMEEKGHLADYEIRLMRKDGSPVWVAINVAPIKFGGGQGVVGTIQDMTARKRAEELAAKKTAEAHAAAEETAIRAEKLETLLIQMQEVALERERAINEVRRSNSQIELQQRLLEQREQERMQIARELHDGPMQEVLGAIYALKGIIASGADTNLTNDLRGVVDTLSAQLAELRGYASELRPPTLVQFGLAKAIQAHIDSYQEKYPDIRVRLEVAQKGELLPDPMRLALYRIYQEAMNNIARHCKKASVKVNFKNLDGMASLEIKDDGCGFEPPDDWLVLARTGHLGLVGMRERAEAVGGKLEIETQPGAGTTIRVEVPLGEAG